MFTTPLMLTDEIISRRTIAFLLLSELVLVFLFSVFEFAPVLPTVILAVVFMLWSLRRPSVWIITVILFHILILQRSEGITIWEILFAIYFFANIGFWFTRQVLGGKKIIASHADLLLLVFIGYCFFSVIPGLLHGASLLKWFRELIIFLSYLMYFPLRDALSDKKMLIAFALPFLFLAATIAIDNLAKYRSAAESAIYAWQLLSGRQTANEPLFLACILVGSSLFLSAKALVSKITLLTLVAFFSVALILTFSRGYWIGALFGMAIFLFLVQGKHRLRILGIIAGLGTVAVGFFYWMFSSLGSTIVQTVIDRLASKSLSAHTDPSLYGRLVETKVVVDNIMSNPFLGYGLGSLFRFYNPVVGETVETWYIHNGYLFLWFKLGIFGLILFLSMYYLMLRDAYIVLKSNPSPFERHLFAGIISLLVSMLAVSVTSPQFITRDSILIIGLCWGIIGAWKQKPAFVIS